MLEPKSQPLSHREAQHLLRRATLSSDPAQVQAATGRLASQVVSEWVTEPQSSWFLMDPPWMAALYPARGSTAEEVQAFLNQNEYYVQEVRAHWLQEILSGGLRARMALFWHNHFVTDVRNYRYAPLAFRYIRTLQSHAFGMLPDFVKSMTVEGAMLYYLDGRFSTRAAPNENYARELMELFTTGPEDDSGHPNYSQQDVVEAARAFTGWRMDVTQQWTSSFNRTLFDSGSKTFLGRTGPFGPGEVIDILFAERREQVGRFIARKLLRDLVHQEPDEATISGAASVMVESGFNIGTLLEAVLSSEWFFDERFMGTHVKSPIEMFSLGFSMAGQPVDLDIAMQAPRQIDALGQALLAPPNVAGWPGHHAWLNTDFLPRRWTASDWMAQRMLTMGQWEAVAGQLIPAESTHPAVDFALALAESLFATPLELVSIPSIEDPFGGDLTGAPLPESLLEGPEYAISLVKMFLSGTPWYEWTPSTNAGYALILNYVRELSRLPEFQLS